MPPATIPESMRHVADLIGVGLTIALMERYGRTRLYVPIAEAITPEHPLATMLGLEPAIALAQAIGPIQFYVPKGRELRTHLRTQQLVARWRGGLGIKALAHEFDICERRVHQLIERVRKSSLMAEAAA